MEKVNYYSLNKYLHNRFGCKVYKIAINGGFTCPNRDGKIDTRGCIFCSKGGSGEFASDSMLPIKEQIKKAKELISSKLPINEEVKYIAYFQAYTNTYGEPSLLREKYLEAIEDKDVVAISIATRPDCLDDNILKVLEEINAIKPVWVELGLQTSNEETANYIRRGYALSVYDEAVKSLRKLGIEVITHVIIGLPGESLQDMLNTVSHAVSVGTNGIKLQLLHVLKNTDLEKEYEAGKVNTLSMEEYIHIVTECLKIIPKDVVVHRLTGDGDKKILVAPLWSADKKRVLNELKKYAEPL